MTDAAPRRLEDLTPNLMTPDDRAPVNFVQHLLDGTIIGSGSGQRLVVEIRIENGEPLVIGDGWPDSHRVDIETGTIVPNRA